MTTTQQSPVIELSQEMKDHLTLNASTETYQSLPSSFGEQNGRYGYFIKWESIKSYHLTAAFENLELIKNRTEARQKRSEILQGDIIRYKDGKQERVTHVWEDGQIQAGGGSSSYYMHKSGGASYSGSLNSGLHLDALELSQETEPALFWMFSRDSSGGGRGIYFYCPVKIWIEK